MLVYFSALWSSVRSIRSSKRRIAAKCIVALLFFFGLSTTCLAQKEEQDYTKYHQGVINAETAIFVDKQPGRGLKIFSSTFEQFDFAFVDDCIEAFQLALFYKKEDYAIIFLKKAMDNGFEIELLNQLVHDCPCEHHERMEDKGALHAAFIKKHRKQLENYSTEAYAEYISRIDSELLRRILNRHMREQLFKDYKPGLSSTGLPKERAIKQQKIEYQRICDDNLRFIDSLARKNIFLGERNLGIYTEKLAEALKITPVAQQRVLMVTFYGLPASTYVPNNSEADYFRNQPCVQHAFP